MGPKLGLRKVSLAASLSPPFGSGATSAEVVKWGLRLGSS
jgi:hypothetical protein